MQLHPLQMLVGDVEKLSLYLRTPLVLRHLTEQIRNFRAAKTVYCRILRCPKNVNRRILKLKKCSVGTL